MRVNHTGISKLCPPSKPHSQDATGQTYTIKLISAYLGRGLFHLGRFRRSLAKELAQMLSASSPRLQSSTHLLAQS